MSVSEKETNVHIEDARQHDELARNHDPEEEKMTLQAYLALAAIASQYCAYLLTLLMPSTIVSYINADLGPDPNYTWINVSWNVAAAVMVTVGGRLSDIFGRRYFMIAGACIALVGAIVGATGQSVNQMIASGVLFGTGGGLQEMCFAAIQEIVPNKYRVFAIGCFELCGMLAFISPIIAYTMLSTTAIHWRTVYYFLFAFEACGLVLLVFFYKPPTFHTKHRADGKTRMELFRQMDFLGVALFATGCICFLLGINWGGRQYAWSSAPVISTIVIGAVLLTALGLWEAYGNLSYPMLPGKLFRNVRGFTMMLVVCFVGGMLYYSMNVLWPRQSGLLFVPAGKPIIAGVYANMVSFGTIIAGFVVVFFCQKVGYERWQLVGFMCIQTALIGSLASIGLNDKIQAIVTIIILATSITPPQLLSFVMISMNIDDQVDIGVANGLASTFRLMGGAVATAIYSAILSNRFAEELPKQMAPIIANAGISASSAASLLKAAAANTAASWKAALKIPGVSATTIGNAQRIVKLSYVQAFKTVYLVAIAFGVVAIVCAACTKSIPREKKTMERAVKMENEKATVHEKDLSDEV